MDSTLLEKVNNLKAALDKDSRVILLNELDKKLNASEEVMKLSYKKDMALVKFEDALKHFGENSPEVKDAQKELYEAKKNLDLHPLVIEYNKAYKEVRILYNKINDELFNQMIKQKGEFDD